MRDPLGCSVDDLGTPALVLDLLTLGRNVDVMAERFRGLPSALRPHAKAHKSAEIARAQIDAGAIGVTTATVPEGVAMLQAGVRDVLIANQVVAPAWIELLVRAAGAGDVTVAVDDRENLAALGAAARVAGVELGALIELDVGMRRGGARTLVDALDLARAAAETGGIRLRGAMGYEGHCADEPDPERRMELTTAAMQRLTAFAGRAHELGLPMEIVSAGSTGTFGVTGAIPGITEVQAGSYVVMDRFHEPLTEGFGFALTVVSTAVSVHGDLAVFDAGRKSIGADLRSPSAPEAPGEGGADGVLAFINEEHVGFRYPGRAPFRVGDRVALIPGYAPVTVNQFAAYHVVREGTVVDVWRVRARHGDV